MTRTSGSARRTQASPARAAPPTGAQTPDPARPTRGRWAVVLGVVLGAAVGFGIGGLGYTLIVPTLESASGWIRELQGLAWNLVPGCALLGAVAGFFVGVHWRRRIQRRAT